MATSNIRRYGASLLTFGKFGAWRTKVGDPCNILIFRLALALNKHGLKMPVLANMLFGPQFSTSQHFDFLSNVTAACLVFCVTHTSWRSFSNGYMFLYSRTILSDKQSEHSFCPTTF